jgi:hypothetical protein
LEKWVISIVHRQADRGAESVWRLGVTSTPYGGMAISFLLHRQAARGAGLSDGPVHFTVFFVSFPFFRRQNIKNFKLNFLLIHACS